jgi:hypothetical protein
MKKSICAITLLAVLVVVGCDKSDKAPPYANVSGTVNFNGKPLPKGSITFAADGRPPTVMDITDGSFSGQALTGSNKITVSYRRKAGAMANLPPDVVSRIQHQTSGPPKSGGAPPEAEGGTEEMIPPEWNAASKQFRVVESGTQNKFEFDIKAKGK